MDKIIVLLSTYNGEKYLRKQIDSILGQKDCLVELLVRDDGSSDDTIMILEEYKERNQLDWYTGVNLGAGKSFYDLILKASASIYYAFADQDDIWDEDKLCTAVQSLKAYESEPALYYSNARITDQNGNLIGKNTYKVEQRINFEGFVCSGGALGCTIVFNSKLRDLTLNGGMPKKMIMHDDYLTALTLCMNGKVVYDHAPHMSYRQHDNNVVGIATSFSQAFMIRYKTFMTPVSVSIAEQAFDIMEHFNELLPQKNKKFLMKVINYKNSLCSRAYLAFHLKTKYVSWKSSVYIRLGLLCGKR